MFPRGAGGLTISLKLLTMKDISFPRLIAEACLVCGDLPQGERGVSGFGGLNQLGGERQAEEMVAHVTIRLGSEDRSISIYIGDG